MDRIVFPSDIEEFSNGLNEVTSNRSWNSVDHGYNYIQYHLQRLSEAYQVKDVSFLVFDNDKPIAAFLGFVSYEDIKLDFPSLLYLAPGAKSSKSLKKFIFSELDRSALTNGATLLYRDYLVDGCLSFLSRRLLLLGAKPQTMINQTIDLTKSEQELKKDVRKSYKSLISSSFRDFEMVLYDSSNISWSVFQDVMKLHFSVVGSKTRSDSVWKHQFELIRNQNAFLILGFVNTEIVSAGYFGYNVTNCLYQMSVSRRDMFDKPIFHGLMMKAILHAKELGCHWFETGEQVFKNHPYEEPPSSKEIGVSLFKAGFGGNMRVFLDFNFNCAEINSVT